MYLHGYIVNGHAFGQVAAVEGDNTGGSSVWCVKIVLFRGQDGRPGPFPHCRCYTKYHNINVRLRLSDFGLYEANLHFVRRVTPGIAVDSGIANCCF